MSKTAFALIILVALIGDCNADPPKHPPSVTWPGLPLLTLPSETKGNVGYHVGGGNPFPHLAEPRTPTEGTWGWDYQGLLPRRVINGWWHGRRYQGGTGAYKSDGPKLHP